MKKENWIWMPHPAHFIASSSCRFVLATYVGKYIVSTVGEYVPKHRQNEGFEDIGANRKYETMVFKAEKSEDKCCPYRIIVQDEVDFEPYNEAGDARRGHMRLCNKWTKL